MKKQVLPVIFCCLIFMPAVAQLQDSGWRRATATHLPNDWTNPQNAFGSDDNYAEVPHQSGCRCPFMDLSWDNGVSYSSSVLFGPYGTTDSYGEQGDTADGWGHSWTDSELNDTNFVLRIWNSSTLLRQGYAGFHFAIPTNSIISGIVVRVEARGDSAFTIDYVDNIEARVYYYLTTPVNEVYTSANTLTVFPNPAHDNIYLRFRDKTTLQKVQLINVEGSVVAEELLENAMQPDDYAINVSRLSPGIYFLNVISEKKTVNARIVIQ